MNTSGPDPCAVVELRQYTLHPGQRDTLIDVFERELIETQEAVDMTVIAQFRDLDRPDRLHRGRPRGHGRPSDRVRGLRAPAGGDPGSGFSFPMMAMVVMVWVSRASVGVEFNA